jgi:protein gp37
MGTNSGIQWTTHTFNPWRGCTKVSAGCANCYAEKLSGRNPGVLGVWGKGGTREVAAESYWRFPLKWDRAAAAAGERHRVFCASLADVFEGPETMPAEALPAVRAARVRLFDLIRTTPNLDWLLLTKRPQHIRRVLEETLILSEGGNPDDADYFVDRDGSFPENDLAWWLNDWCGENPPANVWLGTSVEDQKAADERIPHLLKVPAAVRFLSCEPLLGPVLLTEIERPAGAGVHVFSALESDVDTRDDEDFRGATIAWVIIGGESGFGARPFRAEWAWSIVQQCKAVGVPVFMKQLGERPETADLTHWRCAGKVLPDGNGYGLQLRDKKGAEPAEWPSELQVRELPGAVRAKA